MNPLVQKYAPPAVVLGAALYWGWPPSQPFDLGEEPVQARAVRWKPSDLDSPSAIGSITDPFQPVLVSDEASNETSEQETIIPVGPTETQIRAAVILTGLGDLGGSKWAIINGNAHLPGDTMRINREGVKDCRLIAVHKDHVIVQCEQTYALVRPQVSRNTGKRAVPATRAAVPAPGNGVAPPDPGPPVQTAT